MTMSCWTMPLLRSLAPTIDLPAALFRGRYAKAVVDMEHNGIPVYVEYLHELASELAGTAHVLHPA